MSNKYSGKVHTCGTRMYYVRTDSCVHCQAISGKERRDRKRLEREKTADIGHAIELHKTKAMYQSWGIV